MQYSSRREYGFSEVLRLLKKGGNVHASGSEMSAKLGISRVAVWKHIKTIRSLGYGVESRKGLGYRLATDTALPLPWEVCSGLETRWVGKKIHYFDSIDSTQDYAVRLAQNLDESGTTVIAQRQTRGRGRMNRRWISPEGGVWMSVILRPQTGMAVTLFPLAASVALAGAVTESLGIRPELKWPNDLMVHRKKTAGILVDASMTSNRIDHMVLGVGVNFGVRAGMIERRIDTAAARVGSLTAHSDKSSPVPFIRSFLRRLEHTFESLEAGDAKTIVRKWTEQSSTIGRRITLRTDGGLIRGIALRIDPDGALVVRQGKTTRRILVGDVIA